MRLLNDEELERAWCALAVIAGMAIGFGLTYLVGKWWLDGAFRDIIPGRMARSGIGWVVVDQLLYWRGPV